MISVHFQGKPFNITVIQVYAPTTNVEAGSTNVEWFYEDLQDRLELTHTHTQRSFFFIGDWNAKVKVKRYPK